jgi:hypothetical protein
MPQAACDQQQQQRQAQALDFLQSGVSPEDVTYRRVQQSLSNLGNFVNGQTPEAQFASLSGAGQGAAPFNPGNVQSPSINTNSSLQGLQNAAEIYSGNVNWAEQQANPWTVGLSSLAGAGSILNNAGVLNNAFSTPSATTPTSDPDAGLMNSQMLLQGLQAYPSAASVPGSTTLPAANIPTGGMAA